LAFHLEARQFILQLLHTALDLLGLLHHFHQIFHVLSIQVGRMLAPRRAFGAWR